MEMAARTETKRAQILDGARVVFMAAGFDGASMEAIAHAAGVSKGTLYSYFNGKDELFTTLIAECQNRILEESFRNLDKATDLRENLEKLARTYLDTVREPENLALLRVIVGASAKFPNLGRAFYETGMQPPVECLAHYLRDNASPRGTASWDPELAAVQFFAFLRACVAIPITRNMQPSPCSSLTNHLHPRRGVLELSPKRWARCCVTSVMTP
jgi:AcrR family transcriptional regulator